MFQIKSSKSDLVLNFSNRRSEYFFVQIESSYLKMMIDVCSYTDELGILNLFKELAEYNKPWNGEKSWDSIEGDFKFSATCNILGGVVFNVEINKVGVVEEYLFKTELHYEFGQLQALAKSAKLFFTES